MRAIVIGSGIGGLCAAIALQNSGHEVALYERVPQLNEVGAGISLWANALLALDALGAGNAIRSRMEPLTRSEFRGKNGHVIAASFNASVFEKELGIAPVLGMIHRAELVEGLASVLGAGVAHYGFEAVGIEQSEKSVEVRFANGQRAQADILIGADGIHSTVRKLLFGTAPPRYAGYTCLRGICQRPACVPAGYLAEWWGRGMRLGITTLRAERAYWWATVNQPENQKIADKKAWLLQQYRDWADPVTELLTSTPASAILQNDIVDRPPHRNWFRGRCLLVGDAAHPTTPNLGQGGGLAIEDAAWLQALSKEINPHELLFEEFVRVRFSRAKLINQKSWQLGNVGQWEGKAASALRDQIAAFVLPRFGVQQLLTFARHRVPLK